MLTHQSIIHINDNELPCLVDEKIPNNPHIIYFDKKTYEVKKDTLSQLRENPDYKGIEYVKDGIKYIEVKL